MKYMYLGVIRSRPTAYSKVAIQHNHLGYIVLQRFRVYSLCYM